MLLIMDSLAPYALRPTSRAKECVLASRNNVLSWLLILYILQMFPEDLHRSKCSVFICLADLQERLKVC